MAVSAKVTGPDFSMGILEYALKDGETMLGHVGDEPVLLVRQEGVYYAVGALCSHYQGPLHEGLIVGATVHCPWHHACFDLRTGEAIKAPALKPIAAWNVEAHEGRIYVHNKKVELVRPRQGSEKQQMLIIGAGAAGTAAAVALRRKGFLGAVTLVSEDSDFPYDRPALSKDYLAGHLSEDDVPLYSPQFYKDHKIQVELGVRVLKIDNHRRAALLSDGRSLHYDRCLVATGGTPVKPPIPGIDKDHVYFLRTLKDCRRLIARTSWAQKAVIIGAGFIGLEVASALRARNMEVTVVAPEEMPLMKVVGVHVGSFLKHLHESQGVHFYLGHVIKEIRDRSVVLDDGKSLECDFVVVGTGIHLNLQLAEQAGCRVDDGVLVDSHMETSLPGIYAAGDIAKWPDSFSGQHIRVEHWEVAQSQGLTAAANMLGDQVPYQDVPFFWTQHYETHIGYLGHAKTFDRMEVFGQVGQASFAVAYYNDQKVVALLTVGRDRESLQFEEALVHHDDKRLEEIIRSFARQPGV